MDKPKILVPFDAAEACSIAEAAVTAGISDDTMRRWAAVNGLGRRIGGRWFVSRLALAMFLDGDRSALRELLAGNRDALSVRQYVEAVEEQKKVAAKNAETANAA